MIKATLAFGALLSAAAIPSAAFAEAQCHKFLRVDIVGSDLQSFSSSSSDGCCEPCSRDARCIGYTWSPYNAGTCYLKSGSTGVNTGITGLVSGVRPKSCIIWNNVDFVGADMRSVTSISEFDCCAFCNLTPGCKAFTWSKSAGMCYLKNGTGQIKDNAPGLKSGTV